MNETDIPCSDCGTELEARTAHVRNLPISTDTELYVDVAVCPTFEVRYYPDETLTRLREQSAQFRRKRCC